MKKLLRKNQIIITALVVMVAMAGYLSMTEKEELQMTASNDSVTDSEVADISDEDIVLDEEDSVTGASVSAIDGITDLTTQTKEVSSSATVSDEELANSNNSGTSGTEVASESDGTSDGDVASRDNAGEAVLVSNMVGSNYFEEAKLSREQTRAKNKETLTELVNNDKISSEQKEKAMNEIMKMTNVSEMETATETLLASKGFNEVVVTILDESVDVVVNAENLTEQQIVQIADIVKRKTGVSADKIVISPVGKTK